MMRFHSQTAGVTLTAQQPMNNIVRVAYQAMAAVLGGTQSLHTNSMDETLALPTEHAVQVALRTQQVLAFETGVPNVVDPLGGSYYVEALTDRLEREAEALFGEIERVGGVARALEPGWLQRQIAESAARQQWEVEQQRRVIVGVNDFVADDDDTLGIPLLKVGDDAERDQRTRWPRSGRVATTRSARAGSTRCVPPRRLRRTWCRSSSTPPAPTARCSRFGGHGSRLRRVPRAGLLLRPRMPAIRRVVGIVFRRALPARVRTHLLTRARPARGGTADRVAGASGRARACSTSRAGKGGTRTCSPKRASTSTGLDYSPHLLARARRRGLAPTLRYTRGDMRRLPAQWTGRFDAVLNLFTSFGFFLDPGDDARVMAEFARVLAPGGMLIWHGGSRDGVMARFLARDWWVSGDRRHAMIAHERSFDPLSGVLSVRTRRAIGARRETREHRIRLYTATRLAELCAAAGLLVESAYDGWRRPSARTAQLGDGTGRAEGYRRPVGRVTSAHVRQPGRQCPALPFWPLPVSRFPSMSRPVRVLVAKPGLDGHDRGAKSSPPLSATLEWK